MAAKGNENPEAYRKAQSLRAWSALNWQRGESEVLVKPYLRWQEMDFLKHLPGKPLETNSQTGVGIQTAVKTPLAEHVTLNWGLDAEYTQGEMLQQQDRPTHGVFRHHPHGQALRLPSRCHSNRALCAVTLATTAVDCGPWGALRVDPL